MSRRKKHPEHVNHERWLVSYADFITLLFAFFVVLYSSSQVDKRKVGRLSSAIQTAFEELGAFDASNSHIPLDDKENPNFSTLHVVENTDRNTDLQPAPPFPQALLSPAMKDVESDLEKALAPEIRDHVVEITPTKEGLVVRLREVGFYESGKAVLRDSSLDAVNRLAAVLKARTESIRFEGHTDDVPIHNSEFDSNWELSTARASNLIKTFIFRYGFHPDRLSAAGYAQFHPVTSNQTNAGRAQNRRIDIVILNPVGALPTTAAPVLQNPHAEVPRGQPTALQTPAASSEAVSTP
jgi:chemotaxis protein MotB